MAIEPEQRYYMKLKAAYYYYEQNMTQTEIAELLNVSRLTLGRLLAEAREEGMVRIEIVDHRNIRHCLEAEAAMRERYGLQDAKIVECIGENDDASINRQIGLVAARYLEQLLKSGMRIGIGWGRTLEQMVKSLNKNMHIDNLEIVTLMGGASSFTTMVQPNSLAQMLMGKYGCKAYVINAPYICQTEDLCRAMKADPGVQNALESSKTAALTLVGVGEKPRYNGGDYYYNLDDETVSMLLESGAVGDICAHFFDIEGNMCNTSICRRVVSIDPMELHRHKKVIMIGGGAGKHESVLGALRGGYADVLITDYNTAKAVLDYPANHPVP